MNAQDATILFQLAKAEEQDEYSKNLASMPEELRAALKEQQAEERKENVKKAAKLLLYILNGSDSLISKEVKTIREARFKEVQAKQRIEQIKRARAYAEETNNYLPLAALTGLLISSKDIDPSKLMVPFNWTPKVEKPAAKKVAAKKQ